MCSRKCFPHNRKSAGEAELLIAGRVFVLFLVVVSIIWDEKYRSFQVVYDQ